MTANLWRRTFSLVSWEKGADGARQSFLEFKTGGVGEKPRATYNGAEIVSSLDNS